MVAPVNRADRAGFGWLWGSTSAANLGDGLRLAVLPLILIRTDQSPAAVAGLTASLYSPWLLLGAFGGVIADRFDRVRTMLLADSARALLLAGLAVAVALKAESVLGLYAVAFLLGCGEVLRDTSAQAALPAVVGTDRLERANGALSGTEYVCNRFVGPPLGSLLFAFAPGVAIAADGALALIAAVTVLPLLGKGPPATRRETTSSGAEIREGLVWLARHRSLRVIAVAAALHDLVTAMWWSLLVLYAVDVLGLRAADYGILLSASAAGGLAGSVATPLLRRQLSIRSVLIGSLVVCAAVHVGLATTARASVAAVMLALNSFAFASWNVVAASLRQRLVPDAMLGRVGATFRTMSMGAVPLGALLGGMVATWHGLRASFLLGAPVLLVLAWGCQREDFDPPVTIEMGARR